jgi:hypothetical protein
VKKFWEAYSQYSASQLYRMTHSEAPWRKARGSLPPSAHGNEPIPVDLLDEYFGKQEVPAPLAEYRHELRKREEAEMKLREIPPIDVVRFRAAGTSFTPAALKKAAGG